MPKPQQDALFMKAERQFTRSVLGAIVVGFAALMLASGAGLWAVVRTQDIGALVAHTYDVELALAEFRNLTLRAENARRGFLLQADEQFVEAYRDAASRLPQALTRIAELTKDNPGHERRISALRQDSMRQVAILDASIAARRMDGEEPAQRLFATDGGADLLRAIRDVAREMTSEEQNLLRDRRGRQETSLAIAYAILGLAAVLLLVVASGTIWIVRRNVIELRRARDLQRDLNTHLEGAVAVRTADLQRANDEIQRFAYIVSHDLRSPLVNVMGFTAELDAATRPLQVLLDRAEAEAPALVTEEARLAVREDLPEAIGFIRSSTQKMDRLINAILRLSREGRRIIAPEHLEMETLATGIVASLRHRLTELGAEIAVETPMPGLVSDRVAIEQILSNLVENAIKYAAPGRAPRVTLRGRRNRDRVVYEVEDNGRGIDPKDHERIFDLFRRSGSQDQPGEGIGLAHARAMAYRLGGIVSCESALGKGAIFRLSLPVHFQPGKEA